MGNKKGLLITLIVIIAILVLALGGFVYAYVATDLLKSDEQLFTKYLLQASKKLENFESEQLGAYLSKTKETPYESEGKLTVKADIPDFNEKNLKAVNDLNITFEGKTDNVNKKVQKDIKINYSDDIAFPISYKQIDDLYGLFSDVVIKKYIAVKGEDIDEIIDKLGVPLSEENGSISGITGSTEELTPDMITNTLEKCKSIIKENITKANFSKAENNAYTLTISDSRIVTSILSELENSGILPKELRDAIESELVSKTFKITVNKTNFVILEIVDTLSIGLQISDNQIVITPKIAYEEANMKLTVQKNEVGSQLTYLINCDTTINEETATLSIEMQYSNLEEQTVNETYTLGMSLELGEEIASYDYTLTTSKKFVDKVDIEPLTSENTLVLNEQSEEDITTIFATLVTVVGQINTIQMQQLGLEETGNPLIYATPFGIIMLLNNNQDNIPPQGYGDIQMNEDEIKMLNFNTPIKRYEGIQTGAIAQSLIQTVIKSNEDNPEHKVSINNITRKR